jgi:hypothetical protein
MARRQTDGAISHQYVYSTSDHRWIDMRHFSETGARTDEYNLPWQFVDAGAWGIEALQWGWWGQKSRVKQAFGEELTPYCDEVGHGASGFGAEDPFSNRLGALFGQMMSKLRREGKNVPVSAALEATFETLGVQGKDKALFLHALPRDEAEWRSWFIDKKIWNSLQRQEGAFVRFPCRCPTE